MFDKYGKIVDVDVKMARSGSGPAFAFLEFEDYRDAEDAVKGRDGYDISGNRIRVELHQSKGRFPAPSSSSGGGGGGGGGGGASFGGRGRGGYVRGRGRGGPPRRSDYRLLVSGLPPTGSWQDIKDHMREAGEVVYADVFRDGMGVVEFSNRDDMEWAIKNLDDSKFKSHEGETAFIRVKVDGGISRRSRSRSPRGAGRGGNPRPKSRSASRSRSKSPRSSRSSRSRSRTPPPKR